MNIVQITPGAGAMYCGNCFRDNALVAELRRLGHDVTMVPLYLPLTLDEEDQSADTPIFFGGINVYLGQKSNLFQRAPNFLRRMLTSRKLLGWAAGRTASTRAEEVGDMLLSMLRGEEGRQARELDELITWLKTQSRPDVICLSNALLVGMARKLKAELGAPIVCTLQGEDYFLDELPTTHRDQAWKLLSERARDIDLFIAPTRYFGELMTRRLNFPPEKVKVIYNGINLEGFEASGAKNKGQSQAAPVLGFLARMCKEKGLHTLVEAFIELKNRNNVPRLKLQIAGSCGPGDEAFVKSLRKRLVEAGYIGEVAFFPNLSRAEKIDFLRGLSAFSVPAGYGEAFGMYLIEAMAVGVPVAQPRAASFTELVETSGGGVLCEPDNPKSLADAVESLLAKPEHARSLGEAGRNAVRQKFSIEAMAAESLRVFEALALSHRKS